MSARPPKSGMDSRLDHELRRVQRLLSAQRIHRFGTLVWSGLALAAVLLVVATFWSPAVARWAVPLQLALFVGAATAAAWCAWRERTSAEAAAAVVEADHPDLETGLQAAIQQRPDLSGHFNFLQRRLISQALRHADHNDWIRAPRRRARRLLTTHLVALLAAFTLSAWLVTRPRVAPSGERILAAGEVEVTPGDTEVERGSTVVIAGRFPPSLPERVTLVFTPPEGAPERRTMDRSLSDPVFATTLARVERSGSYHLEYDDERTRPYRLNVYERPALVTADATLQYPDYTGWPTRRIPDTRRISAVAGTRLDYDFTFNVPVAEAVLRDPAGRNLPLEATSATRTHYRLTTSLDESQRLELHLTDDAGRTNAVKTPFRWEALENRRPELTLTFPRSDQRVSPIEELRLQAQARDDFGLLDYGLAVIVGSEQPEYRSLAQQTEPAPVQVELADFIPLENRDLKPHQLVSWFAWAEDYGPDGEPRRTSSDLRFAEVRALDEVFRENTTGGSPSGQAGGGGQGGELVEIQRDIAIATWKLRNQSFGDPAFVEAAETLEQSQQQAQRQLQELRSRLQRQSEREAADEADAFMKRSAEALGDAAREPRLTAVDEAWSAAQGAFQSLLRLQSNESSVARSSGGGGGGGPSRNQGQLDQLRFRNEQDRYATESQAQAPPTPEEREQLEVLSRLRELARRQQDMNQRLQELQTALAAAETEQEREEIRRELKRLEDEQRNMLADLDETRQRVDRLSPGERTREAREQLEQTREDMQRAGEELARGEVGQALASGTRARDSLQQTSEDFRRQASSRFTEQMREARRQARELAADQQNAVSELQNLTQGRQALDDSAERERLAEQLEAQAQRREALLDTLRRVTEESERSEPSLHRELYDLLREQRSGDIGQELATGAELLRRGFIEPTVEPQQRVAQSLDALQRSVERAAGTVLGDETNELRFAQRELDDLAQALEQERATAAQGRQERAADGAPRSSGGGAGSDEAQALTELARQLGTGNLAAGGEPGSVAAPLTGAGFGEWSDRLRTVERLIDDPQWRQRVAQARFEAEEFRRAQVREGEAPQWDLVALSVIRPLQEARSWLQREVNRREQPDALQPVDRDPVPDRYAEAVRRYYEALSEAPESDRPTPQPQR